MMFQRPPVPVIRRIPRVIEERITGGLVTKKHTPASELTGVQVGKACSRGRVLPVDLGAHDEQIGMDAVDIRPVERRRQLQHVDPVCHEADPFVGIPVEAEGEIRLPAALDVGRDAQRLKEEETSAIELGDFKLGMVAASRTRAQLGRPSQKRTGFILPHALRQSTVRDSLLRGGRPSRR